MPSKHPPENKASNKIASTAIDIARVLMLLCIAAIATESPAQTARAKPPSGSQAPAPMLPEPALNKLAGPVALYPDALLAQVLMAATYPLDVAEAARKSSKAPATNAANAAVSKRWQVSVRALLPFPAVLTMLDSQKKWTRELAAAVNNDRANLLDTIQLLRQRAYDNGTLHATREQQVERQDRAIVIKPADTRHVSLPYYDPALAFGAAPDTLLPPEYRAAQTQFAPQNRPAGSGETFGLAVPLPDRGFYDAEIDWRRAELMVRHTDITANSVSSGPAIWQHDPHYRARQPSGGNTGTNGNNGSSTGTENAPPAGSISTGTGGSTGAAAGTAVGTSIGTGGNGQQIGTQPVRPQRR